MKKPWVIISAVLLANAATAAVESGIITGGSLSTADRRIIETIKPAFTFDEKAAVPAPDYSLSGSWAAHPNVIDEADKFPANTAYPGAQAQAAADVFFVHPTTSISTDHWNTPIDDKKAMEGVSVELSGCAGSFNAAAKIYAPRYRQATLYAFFDDKSSSGLKALELAYSDIDRAFRYYIKHFNNGRPFMLAGHSQGSIHCIRLLQEKIIGTPVQGRLVAAYLIGGTVLRNTPGIEPSRSPNDTGTLIGWNSYTRAGNPDFFTKSGITWLGGSYRRVDGRPLLEVNPLSWQLGGGPVAPGKNPGSLPMVIDKADPGKIPALVRGVCGADASGKVLIINKPEGPGFESADRTLSIFNAWSGDYHNYDYRLFYESIRKNAVDRVRHFIRKSR